jgi:glycosyltransferase involved in cell wall biosynthesis
LAIFILIIVLVALASTGVYRQRLVKTSDQAPRLCPLGENQPEFAVESDLQPTFQRLPVRLVSVIIPAYNEADNIRDCVLAVLGSVSATDSLEVWVVDDQSTDETLAIAQKLQTQLADPRLHVIAGKPRPLDEVWMGKNWACAQAVEQVSGEFVLFLDADVRLKPGAIAAAVSAMQQHEYDLLTVLPTIVCGCFAEWLAQPLIMGAIAASCDFVQVNDPKSDKVFAIGHFMMFRRTAYDRLGGHAAVAEQVVEDVELARRIKDAGLKLNYGLGHEVADVRMYQTGAALWEGWTKNWYLGSRCNLPLTLYGAFIVWIVCVVPMLALVGLFIKGLWIGWTAIELGAIALSLLTLGAQYSLRRQIQRVSGIPPRYWWLTGIGGIFLIAIMIASIIKTETGWGWTWRGRPLAKPTFL